MEAFGGLSELGQQQSKGWPSGKGCQELLPNRQVLHSEETLFVVNDLGKGQLRAVQVGISRAELLKLSTIGLVS